MLNKPASSFSVVLAAALFAAHALAQDFALKWDQCGGIGYTGPTECEEGTRCVYDNPDWSACVVSCYLEGYECEPDSGRSCVLIDAEANFGACLLGIQKGGKCGGEGFEGSSTCVEGNTCTYIDDEISICLPSAGISIPPTPSPSPKVSIIPITSASPKTSPKVSPSPSPKTSPRTSPSPSPSPRTSPKPKTTTTTTKTKTTTTTTTTRRSPSPRASPKPSPVWNDGCSSLWEQCGGNAWEGPTCCHSGLYCNYVNDYYWQCIE